MMDVRWRILDRLTYNLQRVRSVEAIYWRPLVLWNPYTLFQHIVLIPKIAIISYNNGIYFIFKIEK